MFARSPGHPVTLVTGGEASGEFSPVFCPTCLDDVLELPFAFMWKMIIDAELIHGILQQM